MENIKVGIIGVGYLGTQHARILSYLEGAELKSVADLDLKKSMIIGNRHGVSYVQNFEEMLDDIDAAIVAAPTSEHFSITKQLLLSGKSALVEKPMTDTVDQAEELVKLAKKNKLILQVGHLERFNPAVAAIEPHIDEPRFIECHRISPFKFRAVDVGVVLDVMIHDLDIVLHIAGSPVKKVEAIGLCRSDWHGWMGSDLDITVPHVPGHELAGLIEAAGEVG